METFTAANSLAQIDYTVYSTLTDTNFTKTSDVLNPLSNMSKLKNNAKPETLRLYKVHNDTIEENFVFIDEENDYLSYIEIDKNKNIILVLSGDEDYDTLLNIFTLLHNRIHTIIYIENNSLQKSLPEDIACLLKTDSMSCAISESYRIARSGQTILLPNTSPDFDFFSHVNFS
jgi:hypothetical protein